MDKERIFNAYKNAESHFDVALTAFVRSPLSIVIFAVWSVGCFMLGKLT